VGFITNDKSSTRRAYLGRGVGNEFFGYVTDIATEQEVYEEGDWDDVDTALVWARERADEIVLTYGLNEDSVFSAGVTYYKGTGEDGLPRWPPPQAVKASIERAIYHDDNDPHPAGVGRLRPERAEIVRTDPPEPADGEDNDQDGEHET
jgi:hypothetical protein